MVKKLSKKRKGPIPRKPADIHPNTSQKSAIKEAVSPPGQSPDRKINMNDSKNSKPIVHVERIDLSKFLKPVVRVERCDFTNLLKPQRDKSHFNLRKYNRHESQKSDKGSESAKTQVGDKIISVLSIVPSDRSDTVESQKAHELKETAPKDRKVLPLPLVLLNDCNDHTSQISNKIISKADPENIHASMLPRVRLRRCNIKQHITPEKQKNDQGSHPEALKKFSKPIPESKLQNKKVPLCISPHSDDFIPSFEEIQAKCLRNKQRIDYEERSSLGTPENSKLRDVGNSNVPIYRRLKLNDVHEKKRKHDQYEFIPDSEEDKDSDPSFIVKSPVKKRRIFKHRMNDAIRSPTKARKLPKQQIKPRNYANKINCILENVWTKKKKDNDADKPPKIDRKKIHFKDDTVKDSIFSSTQIFDKIDGFPQADESVIMLNSGNSDNNFDRLKDKSLRNISCDRGKGISEEHPVFEDLDGDVEYEGSIGDASECHSDYLNPVRTIVSDRCNESSIKDNFGFNEENEGTPRRINIIQDVLVGTRNPRRLQRNRIQPWRFEAENLTRNPHFIQLKHNSLPSVNQETVLDHTFEDRIDEVNKTVLVPDTKKSPIQQSILNYVQSDKDHARQSYGPKSLYNIEELSPVDATESDKENRLDTRNIGLRKRTRRRILGEINDNVRTNGMSTPAKQGQPTVPIQLDLSSIEKTAGPVDFGFDTCTENIPERMGGRENLKAAVPFRLNINVQKPKGPLPEKLLKPVRNSELGRLIGDENEFDKLLVAEGLECEGGKLFEDIDVPLNITRSYKPMTHKKHIQEVVPKKKDPFEKLSKKAQEWINQFNEMCSAVDQEELEIE